MLPPVVANHFFFNFKVKSFYFLKSSKAFRLIWGKYLNSCHYDMREETKILKIIIFLVNVCSLILRIWRK